MSTLPNAVNAGDSFKSFRTTINAIIAYLANPAPVNAGSASFIEDFVDSNNLLGRMTQDLGGASTGADRDPANGISGEWTGYSAGSFGAVRLFCGNTGDWTTVMTNVGLFNPTFVDSWTLSYRMRFLTPGDSGSGRYRAVLGMGRSSIGFTGNLGLNTGSSCFCLVYDPGISANWILHYNDHLGGLNTIQTVDTGIVPSFFGTGPGGWDNVVFTGNIADGVTVLINGVAIPGGPIAYSTCFPGQASYDVYAQMLGQGVSSFNRVMALDYVALDAPFSARS